ncbi:UDP-N-acetyl-D-glucosamine dehydrogenase (plasmid) [Pseudomonas frederiksbergensis]|uniref:UDP-N-acetyl-D-glucosamine dehydrogenase n=1 Tax=Pseudomonas frederiksbergensis TaxID=104087 RepID=A0A1J0EU53_9PSED|nr:UDP-N-acetyl-D-glucosamine 6-dehydrogenase [Pseudomonas frederiksbergensis]APC19674.1 UDP-N-acetyl-D-glucosamine dehydrogenase [Pseudomonas frederiksbergensis]
MLPVASCQLPVASCQLSSILKYKSKEAVVGIVGLGYVGLPLMLRYNAIGYRVLGIDIDVDKVAKLNAGQSYIEHIACERISKARASGFEATTDFRRVSECDALILCVPTPLNKYREPDMSFVIDTTNAIKPYLRAGQVVSLESTTYPGTTEEELLPRVQEGGLTVGENIFLVYSPEREDPGNPSFETRTIPKVIGGHTSNCLQVGIALYEQAIDRVVPVSSTKAAELTKLLENIHRAVNIGLVNEMKVVADCMGIDIFEVVDAAATKPFGFTAYYPGPGLGGHCIPIDPFYLTWKAREYGLHTRFIELSGEVNKAMPEYVVGKLMDGLNNHGKALKGSRVLVLGIAYKKNVDDMRESPSVEIMEMIEAKGGIVAYSDPHVLVFPKMREHHFELSSEPLTAENLVSFDAVVLATDHDRFDYELIRSKARLIVDSRGKYRAPSEHIIKA